MAKITFSDENQAGDIPTFEISKEKLLKQQTTEFNDMLYTREGRIVVCFQSWENEEYEMNHQSFLISFDDSEIETYFEQYIKDIEDKNIDFNFFCFNTYEDAFGYCMDLKEGL